MDEPFSALDVLTQRICVRNCSSYGRKKTMPTQAIFIVTHNIEEAVLLADRIIVLGRNPGHVRTDFRVALTTSAVTVKAGISTTGGLHL